MTPRLVAVLALCAIPALSAVPGTAHAQPTPEAAKPPPEAVPPRAEDEPATDAGSPDDADAPDAAAPALGDEPISRASGTTSFDAAEVRTLGGSSGDVRSYSRDWLVAPRGYNIGGELRFITASTSPDGPRVKFTDLALLRLHSRWTASRRVELSGSIDLLAKQPDSRKDLFFQGGSIGLKVATSRATAIAAGVSGGPTMGDDGFWGSVATGVIHRSRIEEFLAFQYGGGATATALRVADADPAWQAGLGASSELVFHTPRGEWAMWTGFELELPLVHTDSLDPRSRLSVTIGTVFAAVKDWDLYATFAWRDRGTTELPATTLPIIDGGFDQKQFSIGLTRRFSVRGKSSKWALAL